MEAQSGNPGGGARRYRLLATSALISFALLPVAPRGAEAQSTWNGSNVQWGVAGNWNPNGVPDSNVDVIINTNSPSPVINNIMAESKNLDIDNGGVLSIFGSNGSLHAYGQVQIGTGGANASSLSVNTGSTLTVDSSLIVGGASGGTLTIAGGSHATSLSGTIGESGVVGIGTVTVKDANSTWTTTDSVDVGFNGNGTLLIQGGGAVTAGFNVNIGYGGTGTASVDGTNSSLTATVDLNVGYYGKGTLDVTSGGVVTAAGVYLGFESSGVGTVTVDGAGSSLGTTNNPVGELSVGYTGKGALDVTKSGAVTADYLYVGDGGQGTLTIQSGGKVSVNADVYLGFASSGEGTVTVDGNGSSLIAKNVLIGLDGKGALNVMNGGAVTVSNELDVGYNGQGTLTLQNGGAVEVNNGNGTVTIAKFIGSTGTLNIGDGAAPGTVKAASVQFGDGTGTINFNHTATNYEFAPTIAGNNGTINHLAGVTILTGDSTGFMGTTNVSGGGLYVNNVLGGAVNVTGGTLGGIGTLTGALSAGPSGNVAPGTPGIIGTLNVATAAFSGSTFTVQLNQAGNNSHLNATDTVTINGGTVHVTPANGMDTGKTYTPGTVYTIITAANGVSGTLFTSVTDDYAFLNFTLSNDDKNVYLTSQLVTTFCLPGMSANQCAAGNGVFSLGAGTVFNAVLNLSAEEAPLALDKLSGEIHASAQSALIEDSRFVRDAALNRVRSAFDGVAASSMQAFAYAPSGLQPAPANTDRFAVWGHAFGSFGHFNTDGNAARLGRDIGGMFIGGDTAVGNHWRFGALGGYSRSRFDLDARASSGTSDNYHLAVYGGGEWGAFGVRYGGAYSWHDLNTARGVAFTGFADHLAAGYRAGTGQVFGEVGYQLRAGGIRYEPFANLAYVNLHSNGFTESGGAAALVVASQSADTAFSTIGLRAQTTLAPSFGETTLRGTLGWRHAYGDVVPTSLMTFAAGGNPFTIAGVPIAKDALVFDTGLDVKLTPSATLGLSYNGQYGSGAIDQGLKANLTVKF